jgi:DNA/RNA-binding protein KIN17
VRQMLVVGEDPKKAIREYSDQFLRDFLQLLKTGHGEKQVNLNHVYQEYIANKTHIHMNATKWPSLTELAKYLGREGICRVEESEKGIMVSWIDNSPEALRRQEALRRKELQDRGNEEVEQAMIMEQIKRAQATAGSKRVDLEEVAEDRELKRQEGEMVKLSFASKPAAKPESSKTGPVGESAAVNGAESDTKQPEKPSGSGGVSLKMTAKPQTKNVFAQAKKNALAGGSKKPGFIEQPKKISEAERIMKEELERKRAREPSGVGGQFKKKQRMDSGRW